jgi:hypothetical protein
VIVGRSEAFWQIPSLFFAIVEKFRQGLMIKLLLAFDVFSTRLASFINLCNCKLVGMSLPVTYIPVQHLQARVDPTQEGPCGLIYRALRSCQQMYGPVTLSANIGPGGLANKYRAL